MDKKTIGFTVLILLGLGAFQYVREKKDIETHPPAAATPPPQFAEAATPAPPSAITHVKPAKPMPTTPAVRKVTPAPQLAVVTTPPPTTPVRTPVATPKPVPTPPWGKTRLDTGQLEMDAHKGKKR